MIQKRYQYYSRTGIAWTPWFNYRKDDGQLASLQQEEKWQLKGKLQNQFRVI